MFLISILVLKIFLFNNSLAEWIDMPQFSDEEKVYRMPTTKQDNFYKFAQKNEENQFLYTYQNVTYNDTTTEQTAINESEEYDFHKMKDTAKDSTTIQLFNKETVFETNTEEYDKTTVPLTTMKEEDKQYFNESFNLNEAKQYFNESFTSNNVELLNYLPVDILKSVHHTLKSQPTSSEGKIQFLKTFENILITEIESRLAKSIMVNRNKRGTEHYDHSNDHEHAAGFPSIEGALMAISFLTFAVYLVRLVMLLFRNMNNSTNNNGNALFLGRRKKSINKFDDDMVMILKSLQRFPSKF